MKTGTSVESGRLPPQQRGHNGLRNMEMMDSYVEAELTPAIIETLNDGKSFERIVFIPEFQRPVESRPSHNEALEAQNFHVCFPLPSVFQLHSSLRSIIR